MSGIDLIALWIGYGVLTTGGIAIAAALFVGAAILSNRAQNLALKSIGGWKVFYEYRDWYHQNKKSKG
jgi:hypothetical protein